eukprot:Skav206271  [mRNA]  locus=scaffold888:358601:360255:- [translate_table: standard]
MELEIPLPQTPAGPDYHYADEKPLRGKTPHEVLNVRGLRGLNVSRAFWTSGWVASPEMVPWYSCTFLESLSPVVDVLGV